MALDTLSKAIGDTIDLSVGDIVAKFGGDKRAIALAAQKGEIDPTKAVMAGMAVDRVVASAAQPQNTTVAEDVLAQQQPAGLGAMAPQGPQMGQPQMPPQAGMGRPPAAPPPQGGQGLNKVPVPQRGFADGGIVGFQAGGSSASLVAALDRVLSQMKEADPALNTDYVKRSVLSAPPEQQQQLVSDLMSRVSMDNTPTVTPSFSQSLAQREVDPRVMGAMQAANRGLTADEMAIPSRLAQAESGAQAGAPPGVKDFTGSEVYAGIAQRAGNIYEGGVNPLTGAMDIAQSGMRSVGDTGRGLASLVRGQSPEQRLRAQLEGANQPMMPPAQQVDPFSATQTSEGYPGGDFGQADTGAAVREGEPSDIIRQIAEDEQRRQQEQRPPAQPPAEEGAETDKKSIMDRAGDMAREVTGESTIEIPTVAEASKETADLLKESGFDTNLFKTLQADVAKQREELKGDRKEAMNLRLIEAGLGIMGGESPYAFVNIGKGATPAIQGLAKDIKGLKKAERELVNSERDLQMKENDFALGKARISQASIEKARDRADKERSEFTNLQGQFAKTMLSGEIQKEVAKATYGSRMTDFDKKWSIATEDAKRKGVPMTPEFFGRTWGKSSIGDEAAARIAGGMEEVKMLDLTKPEDLEKYNTILSNIKSGGTGMPAQTGGPSPDMNKKALEWANANPNDPKAKQIKSYLGVQ